jgi:hypothetical protein
MNLHQIDYLYIDTAKYREDSRRYHVGEPSGMLVAIAGFARLTERAAARIERWARRPETADYLPRIPAR